MAAGPASARPKRAQQTMTRSPSTTYWLLRPARALWLAAGLLLAVGPARAQDVPRPDTAAVAPTDPAPADSAAVDGEAPVLGERTLGLVQGDDDARETEPDADASPDAAIQRLEIDGLVVDETMTRIGRDFYDVFYRVWRAPEGAINFTVRVQEQPLPNIGTLVSVRVNDELAFQARLQPQLEQIETAAYQAAAYAARQLQTSGPPVIY